MPQIEDKPIQKLEKLKVKSKRNGQLKKKKNNNKNVNKQFKAKK